jgi:uncharacterized RDD family membrane protein YckC
MPPDPSAGPEDDVEHPTPAPGNLELASRGRRLVNYLVDVVCHGFLATLLAGGIAEYASLDFDALLNGPGWYALSIAAIVMYYISCESLFGRTIGKLVTGTRTVTESGHRPSFEQAALRTLVRFVPFEPLSFLREPPIGWHDRWSGTRVVRV